MSRPTVAAARRYARALLEVVASGDPAEVRREIDAVRDVLQRHRALTGPLTHPAVPAEKKVALVRAVFGRRLKQEPVRRLLELLAERHRVELLDAIARSFAEQWNESRGVVKAEAASATPLGAEQTQRLAAALGRAVGRQVEVETGVDAALLGGVLVRVAGRTFDGSLRGRLRALRQHLAGAGLR